MNSFKKNIILGAVWSVIGQFGYVGVVLFTNIILSRILTPYVFGQVGIVMFFMIIFNVLVEGGMGGALIRKKEVTNKDFSTVFVFNLLVSVFLFLLMLIIAPFIADYYKDSQLKNIVIVSSIVLLLNSFQLVHNIKLTRALQFKKKAFYSLISIVIASIIGIFLAYKGFGVWSIVLIQLLNALFMSILLWWLEGGFGKITFSKSIFKDLIGFGANTTISLMINTGFENVYQLVLGKYFSIHQVGFFYQAKRLMDMPTTVVSVTASGAVYSSISQIQNEKEKFLKAFDKILFTYLSVLGLLVILCFCYAEEILLILYGKKWIEAAYYMRILSAVTFLYSANIINELIFKVYDQTKKIVHIMLIKNVIQTISIVCGVVWLNLDFLIIGFAITTFISFILYFYWSRKVLNQINNEEIFNLIKMFLLITILVFAFSTTIKIVALKGFFNFIFIPFITLAYIIGIQYLKILDILTEIKLIVKRK